MAIKLRRKSHTPILDVVGVVMAVLSVGLLGGLIAAKRDATFAFRFNVLLQRAYSFPSAALHRNARCTYGQAWALSVPVEKVVAERAVLAALQVEKREGSVEFVRTPIGSFWIPIREQDVLAETIDEQQRNIYENGASGVQHGDIVLDCGANIGVYTRHALDRGAKLVVAIEPAPNSLQCLRRNFEKEIASGRVVVFPKGVWNKDDELQLSISDIWASTAASVVLDRGGKGPKILLTTIDKLVTELKLPQVDFVKMDIEGAEMEALEGAAGTVRRFRPRMAISAEHRLGDPDAIPKLVHRLWSDYRAECGPCVNVNGSIQPDVVFAEPDRPVTQAQ